MEKSSRQYGLFESVHMADRAGVARPAGGTASSASASRAGRIWLALYFPQLPASEMRQRNAQSESHRLEKLAEQALEFTPSVSLEPPDTLLLEISASLKLFGGMDRLTDRLLDELQHTDHRILVAVAPTAMAALWFVWAERQERVLTCACLSGRLATLSLTHLRWPEHLLQSLRQIGVRSLGECIRLPRDGLARRVGTLCLRQLDQACGRIPEVRTWYRPVRYFSERIETPQDTVDRRLLEAGFLQLLDRLCKALQRNQCGVQGLWLLTEYRNRAADRWRVGLLEASQDHIRLQELLKIHLDAVSVPEPVTAISLFAPMHELQHDRSGELFAVRGPEENARFQGLLERLRARLGYEAITGLELLDDHRPEYAWRKLASPGQRSTCAPDWPERPLWMLPEPRRLWTVSGRPVCEGYLRMEAGPERIEGGWWDGRDIRRDYYIARNPAGMRLWLFRNLRNSHWYLHGLFE